MRNIAILTLIAVSLSVAGISHAAPKIELSTEVWDLGDIYQWTNPSTTIEIRNVGDEDLVISDVKSSCGCTPAFLSESTIKPGETGLLKVDFASYLATGRLNKMVRLTTNDPARKVLDIRVVGNISEDKAAIGRLGGDYVDLGIVAPYETRTFEVMLYNDGNKPLGIGKISLPDGFTLSSSHPGEIKVRKGLPVSFGYRPDRETGLIDEAITFETTDSINAPLSVRVVGYIGETSSGADSLILTPTSFAVDGDGPTRIRIGLKNKGNSTLSIEGVDSSVDMESQPEYSPFIPAGKEGSVEMSVSPDGMEPGSNGYIYIRFGIPVTFGGGN